MDTPPDWCHNRREVARSEADTHAELRGPGSTRYILLTQCLQNDFFLNRECRLYVGDQAATGILAGRNREIEPSPTDGRLRISPDELAEGPLGRFLSAVVDRRRRREDGHGTLHVINIRDWHEPGPSYDLERRTYGNHCEKGTWGARFIDGLEGLLDPGGPDTDDEGVSFVEGSVRICHVHADSVFDFRPRVGAEGTLEGKLPVTELENILDILVQGRGDHVSEVDEILSAGKPLSAVRDLADRVADEQAAGFARVYVAVIGVYSDIKVLTLIGGLLARYDLPNLAVSDTLTGSPTLERHIAGLDFAHKVMHVEVVHGVNDLVRYLGGTPPIKNESAIVGPDGFTRYETFFKDKQSVLAYQSEKLQDYLALTEKRSLDTYKWIEWSNRFLIGWGSLFLIVTLVLAIWSAFDPDRVSWTLPAITGGLSLLQLVTAFFTQPMQDLQRNLMNLTTYRMVLESHSLKMALARFHLTTPLALRDVRTPDEAAEAKHQIEVLREELKVIERFETVDYGALKDLGFASEDETLEASGTAPSDAKSDGSASALAGAPPAAGTTRAGDGAPANP